MEGDEEVLVAVGKLQFGEFVETVPLHGADHNRSRGIARADRRQGPRDQRIPFFSGEGIMRLVQEFEENRVGLRLVVLGDLLPDGDEAGAVVVGILEQFAVGMIIEDDGEMVALGVGDDPVHALEEFRIDRVIRHRAGVIGPIDGHANRIEARLVDDGEIGFLQLHVPMLVRRHLEHVAEIDAAVDRWIGPGGEGKREGEQQEENATTVHGAI